MKKPHIGEIWIANEDNSEWLITDKTIKKKSDIRLCDDDWNEYPPKTRIIYYIHKNLFSTTSSRCDQDFFIENFKYYKTGYKCNCPTCEKIHFKWKNGAEI